MAFNFDEFNPEEYDPDRVITPEDEPRPLNINQPTIPLGPSAVEQDEHNLTGHAEYKAWCEHCVKGQGRATSHLRHHSESEIPRVCIDYSFLSEAGELTKDDKKCVITIVGCVDCSSGACCAMQCSAKGIGDAYAIHSVAAWLDRLGHKRVIVQTDGENAVKAFVRKVKAKSAGDIVLRTSIPGNSASLGAGEQIQGVIAGMFRSLKSELEADLKMTIAPDSALVPWMLRHGPWARTRFRRGHDGSTAYSRLNGAQYRGVACKFGEQVLVKVEDPRAKAKFSGKWLRGDWLGKVELNDAHIVSTDQGVVASRSVRRLPGATRSAASLLGIQALPWSLKMSKTSVQPAGASPVIVQPAMAKPEDVEVQDSEEEEQAPGGMETPRAGSFAAPTISEAGQTPRDSVLLSSPATSFAGSHLLREVTSSSEGSPSPMVTPERASKRKPGSPEQEMPKDPPEMERNTRWKQTGHQSYQPMVSSSSGPVTSTPAKRVVSPGIDPVVEVEAKKSKTENGLIVNELWQCSMEDWSVMMDEKEHKKQCEEMWDYIDFTVNEKGFTAQELEAGRDAEVQMLRDFPAVKDVLLEVANSDTSAVWIKSRWEDVRKDTGEVRCRWVLQEFATTPGSSQFFAATPPAGRWLKSCMCAPWRRTRRFVTSTSVVHSCMRLKSAWSTRNPPRATPSQDMSGSACARSTDRGMAPRPLLNGWPSRW